MPCSKYVLGGLVLFQATGCRPSVDLRAARNALLETDRAWAAVASTNGRIDSVVSYWTEDARVVLPGQPVLVGTVAIRQMIEGTRAIPGFQISWAPDSAVVSPSADFGYTYGTNSITAPDAAGVLRTMEGRYITVWRREPGGAWRCVFDISNEGPPSTSASTPGR